MKNRRLFILLTLILGFSVLSIKKADFNVSTTNPAPWSIKDFNVSTTNPAPWSIKDFNVSTTNPGPWSIDRDVI